MKLMRPPKNFKLSVLLIAVILPPVRETAECTLANPVDLAVFIENSKRVASDDFKQLLDIVRRVPDDFAMGRDLTRVAVVVYTDRVDVTVDWTDNPDLLRKFDVQRSGVGDTRTDLALKEAKQKLFAAARPGAQKVIIAILDGAISEKFFEETGAAAAELHSDGVSIYVALVDYSYYHSLSLARERFDKVAGDASRVYRFYDFDDLKKVLVCKATENALCDFEQTCRFDDRQKCVAHWYRPLDAGRTCDNSRPTATSLQCSAGDCEKICEKWPWQDSPCSNPSNAGKNATVGHQGNAPEPRELYENCPVKFTLCPTGPTSPTTTTMMTTPTKKTTRRTGPRPSPERPGKMTEPVDDSTTALMSVKGSASTRRPGLDTWHIALIAIGALLLLSIFAVLVGCLVVRKKKKKEGLQRHMHHSPGHHRFDQSRPSGSHTGHGRPWMGGGHGTKSPAFWETAHKQHRPQSPRARVPTQATHTRRHG